MKFLLYLACFLPFVLTTSSFASNRFEQFSLDQGLSQNTVNSILQDSQGFLWLGTQDGLNRYDGYGFRVFRHQSKQSNTISDDYILSLHEDRAGFLWVGTFQGGLNKFDPVSETFQSFVHDKNNPNSISSNRISAVIEDSNGLIWAATWGGGISVYNPKDNSFKRFAHDPQNPNSLGHDATWSVIEDSQHRIWIATFGGGLNLFNRQDQNFTRYQHDPNNANSLANNKLLMLTEGNSGTLWMGSENGGLVHFNPDTGQFVRYRHDPADPTSLSHDIVKSLLTDDQGNVWVGTFGGLNKLQPDSKQFIRYLHDDKDRDSISGDVIYATYQSGDGIIWLGIYAGGLNKFNPQLAQFSHVKHDSTNPNSLHSNSIWAITKDSKGTLWLGTDGSGINEYNADNEHFIAHKHDPKNPDSISSNRAWAVTEDHLGYLWVGTYGGGINRYDRTTGKFKRYAHDPHDNTSLSNNRVMAIYEDSQQNLWIGTYDGLNVYQRSSDSFRHYHHDKNNPDSLSYNVILSIKEDSSGQIWVGTYGGGLNVLNVKSSKFTRYRHDVDNPSSLGSDSVMAILEDGNKDIWLATYGGGLNKLDASNNKFVHFDENRGLANDSVYGLLEDNQGNLWMSTNKGLSQLDKTTLQFTNYNVSDGLQSDEFNSGAYYKSPDDELFFGGINGFNHFYPDKIKRKSSHLPIAFTQMHIFNEPVDLSTRNQFDHRYLTKAINHTQDLSLSYLDSLFSLEFSALSYINPTHTYFAYRLKNWDLHWINTDHKLRRATYTNIPAGEYVLQVKARGPDADWDPSIAEIAITISPAPWKTWWAYSIYVLLLVAIVGSFVWQRLRKYQQVSESEERLSLALWASGNELWDLNLTKQSIFRSNQLNTVYAEQGTEHFDYEAIKARVHEDDFDQLWTTYLQHQRNESHFIDATYRVKDQAGQWRWVRNRAKAVSRDSKGQALRIVGTIGDIQALIHAQDELQQLNLDLEKRVENRTAKLTEAFNELKRTQQQLVESEKLASLGGLVAGIAHELNTPLGIAITASSQVEHLVEVLCTQKNQNTLTKTGIDRFETMATEGMALLGKNLQKTSCLVQDFKALAMEQASEQGRYFELHPLLVGIKETVIHSLEGQQIDINVQCDINTSMESHPDALEKVIRELVQNSVLHGFEASSSGEINITALQTGHEIVLQYSDNGVGLSEQTLNQIFDPFFTTKRGTDCTGLGMLIVYNLIVHKLGGTITCLSQPTQGLAVTINMPAHIAG